MQCIFPFVKHGDSTYPRTKPILTDPDQLFRNIKIFDSKETDVILCTPMKSGSHWCYEIIAMLLTGSTEYSGKGILSFNNIESFEDFDSLSAFKDPRLFHTHLPYHLLPKKHIDNGYKVVYLNRNPKDRCVSQFTFLQGKKGVPVWTWNYFFDNFVLKGSHWCYEIIAMLLTGSTEYSGKGILSFNNIESFEDFDSLSAFKDPRLFHTHLPYHLLPKKHIDNGYKVVYLNRNPKDRCVSQFTFLQGKKGVPVWTWNYFFDNFVLKDSLYGGWFNFTKEFEDTVKCRKCVFTVTFESLKMNPIETTKSMAKFLGVPYTDSFINEVADKCSFENLKRNKYDATEMIDTEHRSTLWRKGVVGDWKNWLTIEQNEQFDKLYNKEMKDYNVRFIYNDNVL